jgi:hypothetical protein
MLNRSRITVSFPTPLIFRYHLPLKTKYFRYFTSAVHPLSWLLDLIILNDFENLPIYLISPFPGSQQIVTQICSFELDSFFHIYCMLYFDDRNLVNLKIWFELFFSWCTGQSNPTIQKYLQYKFVVVVNDINDTSEYAVYCGVIVNVKQHSLSKKTEITVSEKISYHYPLCKKSFNSISDTWIRTVTAVKMGWMTGSFAPDVVKRIHA